MRRKWKRWLAGLMTAVMLMSTLPTAAYAALWDNTPDQNQAILESLTEFWGDEKTAAEAMELLRTYGLVDEEGNILTGWSDALTIRETERTLTIAEARDMSEGDVTVNGRACGIAELKAVLETMEQLGLLADNVPAAEWQLQVDGQPVAPAGLAEALSGDETPAVSVLGTAVDSADLQTVVDFLDQYGLLTDTGARSDWAIILPGGERKTDLTELLTMLESGDYDPALVITVDGTPITMADFKTMMEIQKEVERIRSTYFPEGGVEWTDEQLESLHDLYLQLQSEGITLYNPYGADNLVFPSGINQNATITVSLDKSSLSAVEGGSVTATYTVTGAEEGQDISFEVSVIPASAAGLVTAKTYPVEITGNATGTVTIPVSKLSSQWADDTWKGDKIFYLYASNVKNAAFTGGALSHTQAVRVSNEISFQTGITESAKNTSRTVNFTDAQKYFLRNQASHIAWSVVVSGNRSTVFTQEENNPGWSEYNLYYQHLKSGAYLGGTRLVGTEVGYTQRGSTLKNKDKADFYNLILKGSASSQLPLASGSTASTPVKNSNSPDSPISDALKTASSMTLESTGTCDHVQSSWVYSGFISSYDLNTTDGTFDATTTVTIKDTQAPKVTGVTFPAETFSMGAQVPITVTFSEPVQSSGVQLTADGTELSAQEQNTTSKTLTFLYPVKTVGQQRISVTRISGVRDAAGNAMAEDTTSRTSEPILDTITILEALKRQPAHEAEVTDLTYTPAQGDQPEKTTATVKVTIDLPLKNYEDTTPDDQLTQEQKANKDLRNLLLDSYALDNGFASGKVAASIDGGHTLIPLVLDNGTSPSTMTATAEIDASELTGFAGEAKSFVMEFYQISLDRENGNTVTAGDLLFGYYTVFSVNPPVPLTGEHLSVETPEGWQDTIYVNDPPADEQLTLTGTVSGSGYTWSQTRWASDDETVATIDAQGTIHPLKAGTVTFYLEAVNGNLEEYKGEKYRSEGITLTIQEGAEPYLRIPESQMTLRSGDPLTLRWASNLAQKNAEFGTTEEAKKTTFTIAVYSGDDTQGQAVKTYTVTYDPAAPEGTLEMGNGTTIPMWAVGEDGSLTPNQSFLIPGLDDTKNGYTIVLSAQAAEGVPGVSAAERTYTAQTRVTVTAQPVSVSLTRPQRLFVTNEGSLTIPYTLAHFDAEGGGGAFRLTVTDNATGKTILDTTDYTAYGDVTGGSFVLDLGGVQPNDGFRTIYDVSLQAKNTTAGQDWSRDSFTLYIYDKGALDILVQPVTRNGIRTVDVDGNTVTMSNEDWIASLSQDEILALNRDINLQTAISINYGDHAWGEASDRIRWVVENSDTAAVNYPQGAYYENIEGLPYTSYAPASQFLLSGKNDGKTVVQAIHDLAGDALSSSVEVTVETLKDKLYLFQFYPAVSGLTMTYTNGAGEKKTATSDGQGRFAIYEASGIASDVYVKGTVDGEVYLGTVYQNQLVTQEKDAVSLELYPLNSLTLRKVATLPLYLKTPDGADYSGEATVRVGVYRNGEYCPDARYALTDGQAAVLPGDQDQTVTFRDGKATFYFDVTQFNTNNGEDPITAADNIEFVVELRTGKTYYPILFSACGTTNESDAIRMGERILNLEEVPQGKAEQPFLARQMFYFSGNENGLSTDLRGRAGKIGPSADYPDPLLSTSVLWWGEDGADTDPSTKRSVYYTDTRGNQLTGQEILNDRYPFASMPITTVLTSMDQEQVEYLKIDDLRGRGIQLHYVGADGKESKTETMSWSFFNALKLERATDSASLPEDLKSLANISSSADGSMFQSLENDFIGAGITLATQVGLDLPFLQLKLVPTEDPTVFRGIVSVGLNNIEGDNVTGIDADTARDHDVDPAPGLEQIKGLYRQGAEYGKTMGNQLNIAAKMLQSNIRQGGGTSKTGDRKTYYALKGGFETEVYFDFTANRWKMVVMSGGLQAGGGMGYEWTWNTQAGPVPLLAQLELGASAIVDFNAAVDNVAKDNDYLTQLYIYSYLQAFGGLGFDYAVIALKLGMFGQIALNAQLQWLNSFRSGEHFGWSVNVKGSVGMKFQVELLFISYEKILWSQPISVYSGTGGEWNSINDYWDQVGNGTSDSGIIWPDENGTSGRLLMSTGNGMGIYEADLEPKLLDRDYLSQYPRTYDRSGPEGSRSFLNAIGEFFTGGSGEDGAIRTQVIGNSYPQAAPVLSDDGAWMFYLDDMGNESDATAVRVKAAPQSGEGYDARAAETLSDEGYGDSGLKAAGSGDHAVAVWSRITERPATTEPGSSVTGDVQAGMMDSSEIMVAVRNGSGWNVSYLTGHKDESGAVTSDGMADLAPVVATNGKRILVAWRQVASSQTDAITTFDTKDYIMYAVSEDQGQTWTQPQPIYNGTSGSVKGIEAAMLDSGEAAVVFTLQTGEHNVSTGDFQQEVVYAVVDKPAQDEAEPLDDGTPSDYQVVRYVQLTDDEAMDENPQVTAVKLNDSDEQESFVIGWSSTTGVNEDQENDIRLAAVDAAGNRVTGFVDSLSYLTANTGVRISSDFRFSRNADTLDDLSILWAESAVEDSADSTAQTEQATPANRDYLSGLRFCTDDAGTLSVTAAQRVAQMDESTAIDNFDAYVGEDGKLISVLQGTFYDYENPEQITVNAGTESEYTVFLPAEKTSVYLGSGSYTDTMRLDSVIPDYANIKKGMSIPVQLSVTNLGTQPMDKVQVTIGTDTTTFEAGAQSSFVSIAPGETRALTVFYTVPADEIPNPAYTVTGTFRSGAASETEGVLTLNIPDLGIAGNETLLEAKDGQRVLQFTLYNNSDAELAGSGRTVKFNLYSDSACTQPIPARYFQEIETRSDGEDALKTISGNDLAKIDEGYYTVQYRFDLAEYIKQTNEEGKALYADDAGEVRDGGITLYAKAWVETTDENGTGELLETVSSNNVAAVQLESLLKQADGVHVTTSQELTQTPDGTTVTVTLNNNSIVTSETGNVVVWLYDENNNVVDVQQSYTAEQDLITLSPEERKMLTFTFDKPGVRAEVSYGDVVLDEDCATLTHLTFSGLATLADFVQQEDGTYAASVEVSQVSSTTVTALASDPDAAIKVNGQPLGTAGMDLNLSSGKNVLTVEVTSGSETLTYTLTVQNNWPSSSGHTIKMPVNTEHGTVTASPARAEYGQAVTITAKPDEGYKVGAITVTQANGGSVSVSDKGDGAYTFTMPNSGVEVQVTFVPVSGWSNPFADVTEGAWYYDAVRYVNENGLMAGTGANTFAPDLTTTRSMIVSILYRLEGSPDIENEIWGYPFQDVDSDAWYATAVYWARMNGIVAGYSDERFGPDDTITREQMAAILYRYAQYKGYDTTARADLSRYTDAAQVSSWAADAIRWANAEGLVSGTGSTTLSPQGSATRSQMAMILMRLCERYDERAE